MCDLSLSLCTCALSCVSLLAGLSDAHVLPSQRHLPIIERHRTIPLFRHHHHHHHHRRHLLLCPLIRVRSDPVRRLVPPIFFMSQMKLSFPKQQVTSLQTQTMDGWMDV
uniref:Putative secreted protein n=1 Tax=Anopheles darlingi TaxID=43151 RepID=A0A2M4D7V7_ANODA